MAKRKRIVINEGDRFGRLVVIAANIKKPNRHNHNIIYCRVRCDCGNELDVMAKNLFMGNSSSCGCLHREILVARNTTHGESKNPLYGVWQSMRRRCQTPVDKEYPNYGGRGIKVCREWNRSFASFYNWAIRANYRPGLSIERIDVNGDYEPANCCFIPMNKQAMNTRANMRLICFGETKTAAEWARDPRCVVQYGTLTYRIRSGWNTLDALTVPANPTNFMRNYP